MIPTAVYSQVIWIARNISSNAWLRAKHLFVNVNIHMWCILLANLWRRIFLGLRLQFELRYRIPYHACYFPTSHSLTVRCSLAGKIRREISYSAMEGPSHTNLEKNSYIALKTHSQRPLLRTSNSTPRLARVLDDPYQGMSFIATFHNRIG